MKKINILILLLISIVGFSQNDFLSEYQKAESLVAIRKQNISPASRHKANVSPSSPNLAGCNSIAGG